MQQMTFVEQSMFIIAESIERLGQGEGEGGSLVLTMCVLVCNDDLSDWLIVNTISLVHLVLCF